MSAHKAHRVSRGPRASLAKKAIQETLVNKVLLVYKALSGCMARWAHREWLAHQLSDLKAPLDPQVQSVHKANRVFRAPKVPIVVVQEQAGVAQ